MLNHPLSCQFDCFQMFAFLFIPLPMLSSDPWASQDCSKSLFSAWFPGSTHFADTSTPFPSANYHKTSVSSLFRMAPTEIGIQGLPRVWFHSAASPRMPHSGHSALATLTYWALIVGFSPKGPNLYPQPVGPSTRSSSSSLGALTGFHLYPYCSPRHSPSGLQL